MANSDNKEKEEPHAIIRWRDGKTIRYHVSEMNALRKSSGGFGWLFFRPDKGEKGVYEKPSAINLVDPPPPKPKRRLGV